MADVAQADMAPTNGLQKGESVIDFQLHVELKYKCIAEANAEMAKCDQLETDQLRCICRNSSALETPKQRLRMHKQNLQRIVSRLQNAPDKLATAAASCFRDDIGQLYLDLQQILKADIANAAQVTFRKLIRKKLA